MGGALRPAEFDRTTTSVERIGSAGALVNIGLSQITTSSGLSVGASWVET